MMFQVEPTPANSDASVRFGGRGVEECRGGRLMLFGSWEAGLTCHMMDLGDGLDRAGSGGAVTDVRQVLPSVRVLAPDAQPRHPMATGWSGMPVRDLYGDRDLGRRAELAFLALYEGIPFPLRRLVLPLGGFQWSVLELAARIDGFAARLEDMVARDLHALAACLAVTGHLEKSVAGRLETGRALMEREPLSIVANGLGVGAAAVSAALSELVQGRTDAAEPAAYERRLHGIGATRDAQGRLHS